MGPPKKLKEALPGLLKEVGFDGKPKVVKLAGDASLRLYFRIFAGSRNYIAMVLPDSGPSSKAEEITKTTRPITKLPFIDIQEYLEYRRVLVPSIYAYNEAQGILLLEDFGDQLLYNEVQGKKNSELKELYEMALEQLERLSLIPDTIRPEKCIAFSRAFDKDLYNWEFLHFVEYAFDKRLKNPPKGKVRENLLSELNKITEKYLSFGNILCHRDYHSKNLMTMKTQFGATRLGVIDFQDALVAPLYYDLASLLRDAYVKLDSKLQNDLIENYRKRMMERKYNGTESKDAFRRNFDLIGIQRNMKAAGRFFYIDEVKKNPSYLQYVPLCLDYISHDLNHYEELKPLKNLMLPHFEELKAACKK